jgi:MFS family permease
MFIYHIGKYSAAETAAYTVMFAITGGMGQIIWGGLSDKVGRKLSFMCIFIWAIVGFYGMRELSLISLAWLIGAQVFVGFSTNAPYPIFYAVAYDVADRRVKGLAMGFIDLGFYLGALLLLLTGALIEWGGGMNSPTGYYWVLYMLMIIYALATLLTLLFTRETKGWFFKHDWALVSRASSNIPEI